MDSPSLKELDTYNRVPSLISPIHRSLSPLGYVVVVLLVITGIVLALFTNQPAALVLGCLLMAMIIAALLYSYSKRHRTHCRYCKHPLSRVIRPLLLSGRYLSMQGIKRGNAFFTRCRWGLLTSRQRWAKISHQSKACHYCRLVEKHYDAVYEQPNREELAEIQAISAGRH